MNTVGQDGFSRLEDRKTCGSFRTAGPTWQ